MNFSAAHHYIRSLGEEVVFCTYYLNSELEYRHRLYIISQFSYLLGIVLNIMAHNADFHAN